MVDRSRDSVLVKLGRAVDSVLTAGGYVCAALTVFVTLLLLYEVFTRYILHRPSMWSLDIATYALLYLALIGAPWLLKEDGHIKIEIITSRLTERTQAFITGVTSVIASLACAVFCWQATILTLESYSEGHFIDRSIVVSRYLVVWVIAFGTFFLSIQFARRAYEHFHTFSHLVPKKSSK